MLNSTFTCCSLPNNSISKYSDEHLPETCHNLETEMDLVEKFNDSEQLMFWYQQCFGPREPPPITWQELILPLLLYGYKSDFMFLILY